jgi:hypothetical protein
LFIALAAPARADEDAKAEFERGTALFALHKFSAAAAAFEKAFELRPDPAILYNAAQAHRLSGNKPRALDLYESLLRLYGPKLPNRVEVNNHVRELRHAIEVERHATGSPPLTPLPEESVTTPSRPRPATATPSAPAPVVVAPAPPPPQKESITKRRWFWPVIGGAAAVVIAGVTVGIVLGTTRTVPPTPTFGSVPGN